MNVFQKIGLVTLSAFLILSTFASISVIASTSNTTASCPPASTLSAVQAAKVKFPLTACVVDSFGNVYSLKVTGSVAAYQISGSLVSSPYLAYTPWSVNGFGSGASFSWVSTDPNPSDPNFCTWHISATITGHTAAGTWANFGCHHEGGTVTLGACTTTSCTAAATAKITSVRPGA